MSWLAATLWDLIAPSPSKKAKAVEGAPRSIQAEVEVKGDAEAKRQAMLKAVGGNGVAGGVVTSEVARGEAKAIGAKTARANATSAKLSMQQRYDALVVEMKGTYGIRVRKWRKSSSGVAWIIRYRSGREVKLIESPYPRGPMSCAIFLHEVGHHAIGLGVHRPRCLEEYVVWVWALQTMREKGFNVTPAVERRVQRSMRYAVGKAKRRGIRELPPELQAFA